jgi:protein tyrosine/serine phosphatase
MKQLYPVVGAALVAACAALPVAVALEAERQTPNFHVVRDGVLYRGGQMTLFGLKRTVQDLGIKTVVNLREGVQPADRAEEAYCRRAGVHFVRIPPMSWDGRRGSAEIDRGVDRFLATLRDPKNHPVLVHCFAGIHRTGGYCAIYRMAVEGWDNDRAVAELKGHGYSRFDDELDIRGYLTTFPPARPAGLAPPQSPR